MIDHSGTSSEPFHCSTCKTGCEAGHYYHRVGNDIFCSESCKEEFPKKFIKYNSAHEDSFTH